MSKYVPVEAMKILADALEEFSSMVEDNFEIGEFKIVLNTNTNPADNVAITVSEHPEEANKYVMSFE